MKDLTLRFRAILIFYRGFWIPATLITLFCCGSARIICTAQMEQHEFFGILTVIAPFFWVKTFTNFLVLLYLFQFKASEMYFYANLGIRKRELVTAAFLIDYLGFFIAVYLTGLSLKLPLISF